MGLVSPPTSHKVHADTLRIWPCLLLLLLSGVTWFLPLTPAVKTLETRPRPPFPAENEPPKSLEPRVEVIKNQTDQILQKALKAAGCEDGKSFLGQDCELLEKMLSQANTELLDVGKEEGETEEEFSWNEEPDILPELRVDCWCPAQFEDQQVKYTNRQCASHVNRRIRGLDFNDRVYKVFTELRTEEQTKLDLVIKRMTQKEVYIERADVFNRYNSLITRRTSLLMFIFALVLLVPNLLWWKLSPSICCGLNIEKTLDMMEQVQRCDQDTRRNLYQTVSRKTAEASHNKLAKFFLSCKFLACCASLAVLFSVCHVMQTGADTLVEELGELSDIAKLHPLTDHFMFHCHFFIRQMQNVHDYTVQCLTSFPGRGENAMNEDYSKYKDLDAAKKTLMVYGTLFQILSAFLILHATVNGCGFLSWVWKLYVDRTCSNGTGSSGIPGKSAHGETPEDVRFFLCVVHEQLGHVVSGELWESFVPTTPDKSLPFLDPERKGNFSDDNA